LYDAGDRVKNLIKGQEVVTGWEGTRTNGGKSNEDGLVCEILRSGTRKQRIIVDAQRVLTSRRLHWGSKGCRREGIIGARERGR